MLESKEIIQEPIDAVLTVAGAFGERRIMEYSDSSEHRIPVFIQNMGEILAITSVEEGIIGNNLLFLTKNQVDELNEQVRQLGLTLVNKGHQYFVITDSTPLGEPSQIQSVAKQLGFHVTSPLEAKRQSRDLVFQAQLQDIVDMSSTKIYTKHSNRKERSWPWSRRKTPFTRECGSVVPTQFASFTGFNSENLQEDTINAMLSSRLLCAVYAYALSKKNAKCDSYYVCKFLSSNSKYKEMGPRETYSFS